MNRTKQLVNFECDYCEWKGTRHPLAQKCPDCGRKMLVRSLPLPPVKKEVTSGASPVIAELSVNSDAITTHLLAMTFDNLAFVLQNAPLDSIRRVGELFSKMKNLG